MQAPRTEVDPNILAALTQAASRTGTDPALLTAMAWRESRLDPQARNSASSATGLMQFTDATWLEAVRDHGAAHGLSREAAMLSTDPRTGRISAPTPQDLRRVLDLRLDPHLSALLAAAQAAAVRPALEAGLRRRASAADLYAAHMLGTAGARRFLADLASRPHDRAADSVGASVAQRNRSVFFAPDGRSLSLREVHAALTRSVAVGSAIADRVATSDARLMLAAAVVPGR